MIPFAAVAVLLGLAAWCLLRSAAGGTPRVVMLLALPLLYAALVLALGFERLDALELRYVGKRLAWGPGVPVTGGGSPPGAGDVEDLHAALLAPHGLRIEPAAAPAPDQTEDAAEGAPAAGEPVLVLSGLAPVAVVDGEVLNAVRLEDGDVLRVGGGGQAGIELVFHDGLLGSSLTVDGAEVALPGAVSRFGRPGRVAFLPDLLAGLEAEAPDLFSYLAHDDGAWHAVLRDERLEVVRGGEVVGRLGTPHPLPRGFALELRVVRGTAGDRRLRTVRRDRLRVGEDHVEVRFAEPERHRQPLADVDGPLELGLVVPSSVDRRPRLIELGEHSARFHGLVGSLRFAPATGTAALEYLGGEQAAEPGALYGLGEGDDLMLLRLERLRFPAKVLWDLALLALYLFVFLGPALRRSPVLAVVAGGAGLLLAHRLLFAWRAATQPPDFFVRGYAEARVALWLVPALLLFGWTAGFVLRRLARPRRGEAAAAAGEGGADAWRGRARGGLARLAWPLLGLATAALGCLLTAGRGGGASGDGDLGWLALVPLLLAAALLGLYLLAAGPLAGRVRAWGGAGWRWPWWGLAAAGGALLLLRGLGIVLGMPEAARLPGTGFRLLWTVLQLPVSALALGLACHHAQEDRERPSTWLTTIALIVAFLAVDYALVGLLADDTGLLLVHGLAVVFALVLLLARPPRAAARGTRDGLAWTAGAVLLLLPLALVLAANLMPRQLMAAADLVLPGGRSTPAGAADDAEALRATPAQQLFRLYLLANPDRLREVGVKPAEQVAVQHATMESYATEAGFAGGGFHSSKLPRHLGVTYLNDLMPMSFVLADFGTLGMLALALDYLVFLLAAAAGFAAARDRWGAQGAWIAAVALLAFALPGLYMTLANLNLVLFTGKNPSLLALNSVSDVLLSAALLAVAAFGAALAREAA